MASVSSCDVTVVIYAHDAEAELEACVAAALAQEGATVEVVVVDDVSVDQTPIVAHRLAVNHEGVSVVSRIISADPVAATFDGLRAARGRYALVIGARDRLRENVLAALVSAGDAAEADIVCPSVALVDAPGAKAGTERVPRLERPLATTFERGAIAGAIFEAEAVAPRLRGRLFETRLLRNALAEIGEERLGEGADEAVSFISACLARRLVGCPEIVAADIVAPEEPTELTPELAQRFADARRSVAQVVFFLDHRDAWGAYERVWERYVGLLVRPYLELFPRRTASAAWGEVGEILLRAWGPSVIAQAAAERPMADRALIALALAGAPCLTREAERPTSVAVLVPAAVSPEAAARALDLIGRRITEVVVLAEEGVDVAGAVVPALHLPAELGRLARSRILERFFEEHEISAAVFFSASPEAAADELSARFAGLATALVVSAPLATLAEDPLAIDIAPVLEQAPAAALASVVACEQPADGALWALLGARTTMLEGLVAQLTLASGSTLDANERLLAARLIETARTSEETLATANAQRLAAAEEAGALKLLLAAKEKAASEAAANPYAADGGASAPASAPASGRPRARARRLFRSR